MIVSFLPNHSLKTWSISFEEKGLNLNHFEIRERGLSYQGAKRIDFYDLFSYQRARGAIARTVYQEIVFEEAIPIDQEFLYVGGRTEQ